MIIKSLIIQSLYGHYDYVVRFNPDLTFLFGENGCGKTTILNILEAIVSGRIYQLFAWQFERIVLGYCRDEGGTGSEIIVTYSDDNICVNWNNNKTIRRAEYARVLEEADSGDEVFMLMCRKYPILSEIKSEFNYIYLPLNRGDPSGRDVDMLGEMARFRRAHFLYDIETRFGTRNAEIKGGAFGAATLCRGDDEGKYYQ